MLILLVLSGFVNHPSSVEAGNKMLMSVFHKFPFVANTLSFQAAAKTDPLEDLHHGNPMVQRYKNTAVILLQSCRFTCDFSYCDTRKTLKSANRNCSFELNLQNGSICECEIIVLLGQNGVGKTTFIRLIAGLINDDNDLCVSPQISPQDLPASYMAQNVRVIFEGTVVEFLREKIAMAFEDPQFQSDVIAPLRIQDILDTRVKELSPCDLQRVHIVLTLGKRADVYLLDEPLAHLDVEQRIVAAAVIKRFIQSTKRAAFIVEHDWMMASCMAQKIVVFEGRPGVSCTALSPKMLLEGVDHFLRQMGITARCQTGNVIACINQLDSVQDIQQKASGKHYFCID
jgi:ATP-binding cassette subfamily E protein 1